jgi:DUF438 domain-containing protein
LFICLLTKLELTGLKFRSSVISLFSLIIHTLGCSYITLSENGEIINDPAKVSEVFNEFFINVAKNIGNTNVIVNKEHPSVCMIKENKLITNFDIVGKILTGR